MKKIINIVVKPNSRNSRVIEQMDGSFKVEVKAPATDGKANKEVEKLLSKHFEMRAEIIRGHKSKRKIIELWDS